MKPAWKQAFASEAEAAAFGRLCVETRHLSQLSIAISAAAFGRLCVETEIIQHFCTVKHGAAAFGRLCVETIKKK